MPKNPKWPPFLAATVAILDHVTPKTDRKAILNPMKLPKTKIEAIWQLLKLAKIQNGGLRPFWSGPIRFVESDLPSIYENAYTNFQPNRSGSFSGSVRQPLSSRFWLADPRWPPKIFWIQNYIKWSQSFFRKIVHVFFKLLEVKVGKKKKRKRNRTKP